MMIYFLQKDKVKEDIILKENDILTPGVTSLENIGKMVRVNSDMPNTTVGGSHLSFASYLKKSMALKVYSSSSFKFSFL